MVRTYFFALLILGLLLGERSVEAQESPDLRVVVNMVQLNVAVTDKNGNYITGLRPKDFVIAEDGISERAATFAEGNEPARSLSELADDSSGASANHSSDGASPKTFDSLISGANVFVLFDTSDYMYRGFVFAQDAIAEFVRSLGNADKIAFYSYSRDLSRAAPLTSDRTQVVRAVRSTVAVFDRMTAATGGKVYFAKDWRDENKAFASIRDDLAHLYSLSYYPKPNPNAGWRAITVRLVGEQLRKYKVRTRNGYRPQPSRFSGEGKAALSGGGSE